MKKGLTIVAVSMLVLSLLLSVKSTAKAVMVEPSSLPDPVVTPVSRDMEFTTTLLPVQQFPGTQDYNQMLVPVGFTLGQAQFLDTGVVVSGLDSGEATACFTFTGAQSGWGGKVGVWNGTKWVLLSTTIKNLEESPNSLACAPITGNGTYVFIRYIADPSKLAVIPECSFTVSEAWTSYGGPSLDLAIYFSPALPDGTPVTYSVLSQNPSGIVHGTLSGSTTTFAGNFATFPVTYDQEENMISVVVHVELTGCYKNVVFDYYIDD